MKKYVLFAAALLAASIINAQVAGYRFVHESGQLLEVQNYPGAVITGHNVQDDVLAPGKVKLTFPFRFGGRLMDSVGVHENGYLFFGSIDPFAIGGTWPVSGTHPSQVTGVVSALGLDLHPVDIPAQKTTIKTAIVGTAPMRIFIAQWKGTSRIDALSDPAGPDNIMFQIKLYETTNRVEIAYGQFDLNPNITEDAEIGIKGAVYSDYANRVPSNADWSSSVAGTSQMARKALSAGSKPGYGTLYVWEPGGTPTSITERRETAFFDLYPVPASDVLHLSGSNTDKLNGMAYSIIDMSGRLMLSGKISNSAVMVDKLAPGAYVLVLNGQKGSNSKVFSKY